MRFRDYVRLGLNHHLLYADHIKDTAEHLRTLHNVLFDERFDIVDMWYPWSIKDDVLKAVKDSGKVIYYNMGNRAGQRSLAPASLDTELRNYSLNAYYDELERASLCGAAKVITNSGPNDVANRQECIDYLVDFYVEFCKRAYPITVIIEPVDWNTSKCKLIGSSAEAADVCRRVRQAGCPNMGSMVDMCHVPLMHETLSQAIEDTGAYLEHIHLGNCVLDKTSPIFGDKHPGLGIEGGVYDIDDIAEIFSYCLEKNYFSKTSKGSASIEMRRLPSESSEESLNRYYDAVCQAWLMASEKVKV